MIVIYQRRQNERTRTERNLNTRGSKDIAVCIYILGSATCNKFYIWKEKKMNKLITIVSESGLEKVETQTLMEKFGNYEAIANEWEIKAKAIVVTDITQTTEMAMAKEARKKFSQLRIDVERTRKELKEKSLRKGQAIDAVARFLVSLIQPIEEHLKLQEDFTKIAKAKKAEELRIAEEERVEKERLQKEEADRKEQKRIRQENEKLKKEAEAKDKQLEKERVIAETKRLEAEDKAEKELETLRKEAETKRLLAEKKANKEQEKLEAQLKKEAEARAKIENEIKEKAEKELETQRELDKAKEEKLKAPDKGKYLQYLQDLLAVEVPVVTDNEIKLSIENIRKALSDKLKETK